jgi:histone H3/H4
MDQEKAQEHWKTSLPLARIKSIMKLDPHLVHVTADAVYAVTVATQLFLELLTMEGYQFTQQEKRSTLSYRDISNAINDIHEFEFLTEIVPFTLPFEEAVERKEAFEEMVQAQKEIL